MRTVSISFLAALALGIGCSSNESEPAREVGLSIKVGQPGAAAGVSRLALNLPDGIELTRVRLILKEVELEHEDDGVDDNGDDNTDGSTDDGVDDNGDDNTDGSTDDGLDDNGDDNTDGSTDDGEAEIEFGPFLVDLDSTALAGEVIEHIVSAMVPQGTYEKLKFKIDRIDARAGDPPALADLTGARVSVLIEGTIDGEPFTFAREVEAEQELRVNIVVGDGGSQENLTLFLNADAWFVDPSSGERLDPRDVADALQIEANIRGSVHAEDDDDHDGVGDDDDEDDDEDRSGENEGHEGEDEDEDEDEDGGVEDDGGNSGSH